MKKNDKRKSEEFLAHLRRLAKARKGKKVAQQAEGITVLEAIEQAITAPLSVTAQEIAAKVKTVKQPNPAKPKAQKPAAEKRPLRL